MGKIERIEVPVCDREKIEGLVRDRNTPQKVVWRARIVLLTGEGMGAVAVAGAVGKSDQTLTMRPSPDAVGCLAPCGHLPSSGKVQRVATD